MRDNLHIHDIGLLFNERFRNILIVSIAVAVSDIFSPETCILFIQSVFCEHMRNVSLGYVYAKRWHKSYVTGETYIGNETNMTNRIIGCYM